MAPVMETSYCEDKWLNTSYKSTTSTMITICIMQNHHPNTCIIYMYIKLIYYSQHVLIKKIIRIRDWAKNHWLSLYRKYTWTLLLLAYWANTKLLYPAVERLIRFCPSQPTAWSRKMREPCVTCFDSSWLP